jgi:hypothetical protein
VLGGERLPHDTSGRTMMCYRVQMIRPTESVGRSKLGSGGRMVMRLGLAS